MQNGQVALALIASIEDLLNHAIELEDELELFEEESRQWIDISNELSDTREKIGWSLAQEYKQIQ